MTLRAVQSFSLSAPIALMLKKIQAQVAGQSQGCQLTAPTVCRCTFGGYKYIDISSLFVSLFIHSHSHFILIPKLQIDTTIFYQTLANIQQPTTSSTARTASSTIKTMVPDHSKQNVAEINPGSSKLHHSIESEYQLPFNKTATMGSHSAHAEALSEKLQQLKQEQLGQQPNGRHSHHASASTAGHRHHNKLDEHSSSSDKRTPHDSLQEILVRIEKQHHEKELEKEKERELEAEILRRHNHRRLSPDILKDHLHHTLSQNHGNANLRHS